MLSLEIVISFILSQFLVIVIQVVIACIVVFAVFRVPCDGPAAIFVLLCLLQGDQWEARGMCRCRGNELRILFVNGQ